MQGTAKPDRSLPRSSVLRGRDSFALVKKQGRRLAGRRLVLNYLDQSPSNRRVAFILTRACGKAVDRNRIRRRMRDIYRHLQEQLPAGLTSIWIVRPGSDSFAYQVLKEEMIALYQRAELLPPQP